MFFAFFLFWAGCMVAIGLVIYNIVKKVLGPRIAKKMKKLETFGTLPTLVNSSDPYGTEKHLLTRFIEEESSTKFSILNWNNWVSAKIMKEGLKKFFTVQTLSEVCEWDRTSCTHYLKLVSKDGTTMYLTFKTSMMIWRNESRELWTKSQEDGLEIQLDEQGKFEGGHGIILAVSPGVDENNSAFQDLVAVLNMARIDRVYIRPEQKQTTNVSRFAFDANIGYYLQETEQEIKMYSDEVINASYNDMPLEYNGETYYRPASTAMDLAEVVLRNRRNVYIFGTMGSGKTTFARQILARMTGYDDVRVVSIPATMFKHLQEPAAQSALVNLLSSHVEVSEYDYAADDFKPVVKKMLNIIYIDEAEVLLAKTESGLHSDIQSFLLPMLDGEIRDILNCQTILVFNKDKEYLNPTIFRSLRGGMEFNVQPLPMDKAKELVKILKVENVQWRFDEKKFHKFITDQTLGADGILYAPAGFTTLADVVSCFYEPTVEDAILAAIRGTDLPKPKPKAAPKMGIKINPVAKSDNIESVQQPTAAKTSVQVAPPVVGTQKKNRRHRWRK